LHKEINDIRRIEEKQIDRLAIHKNEKTQEIEGKYKSIYESHKKSPSHP